MSHFTLWQDDLLVGTIPAHSTYLCVQGLLPETWLLYLESGSPLPTLPMCVNRSGLPQPVRQSLVGIESQIQNFLLALWTWTGDFASLRLFPTRRKGKSFTNLAERPSLSQNSLPGAFPVQAKVKLQSFCGSHKSSFNSLGLTAILSPPRSLFSILTFYYSAPLLSHIYYLAPRQDISFFCRGHHTVKVGNSSDQPSL